MFLFVLHLILPSLRKFATLRTQKTEKQKIKTQFRNLQIKEPQKRKQKNEKKTSKQTKKNTKGNLEFPIRERIDKFRIHVEFAMNW